MANRILIIYNSNNFLKPLSLRQFPSLHAGVRSSSVEMAAALMLVTSATTILTAPTDPTRKIVVGFVSLQIFKKNKAVFLCYYSLLKIQKKRFLEKELKIFLMKK